MTKIDLIRLFALFFNVYYLFQFGSGLGIKSWLIVPYFVWLLIATPITIPK